MYWEQFKRQMQSLPQIVFGHDVTILPLTRYPYFHQRLVLESREAEG